MIRPESAQDAVTVSMIMYTILTLLGCGKNQKDYLNRRRSCPCQKNNEYLQQENEWEQGGKRAR